ncbi:unnamed protein product [Auanema sp. JU1783]|nr:unnamed protein product [Auanema sp. JU1783]
MNLTDHVIQETEEIIDCSIPINERRWYLVAVAGTSLSLISFICNLIIAKVLLSSKHSHFYFLAILALSDSFLSFMYGPVIAMDIIKDRLQILWLTKAYWSYLGPLLSLCQTSMTFSTYLIILATIERYLITHRSRSLTAFRRCRTMLSFVVFMLSLLLRGTAIFEIEVQKNFNCTGVTEYLPGLRDEIVGTFWYGTVFRFYTRNIMTVFLPFIFLAYLNYSIVKTLRKQQRSAEMFRFLSSDHKTKIRSATRLMVTVVCSYLLANVLNVLITFWEHIDSDSTQQVETYQFYETCTDVISVLYIFVCATRLIVYYSLNKEIREDIQAQLCHTSKRPKQVAALPRFNDGVGQQVGTEIDAVAIAIARRLMSLDIRLIDPSTTKTELSYPDSPVHAIIYANKHCRDEAEPV